MNYGYLGQYLKNLTGFECLERFNFDDFIPKRKLDEINTILENCENGITIYSDHNFVEVSKKGDFNSKDSLWIEFNSLMSKRQYKMPYYIEARKGCFMFYDELYRNKGPKRGNVLIIKDGEIKTHESYKIRCYNSEEMER